MLLDHCFLAIIFLHLTSFAFSAFIPDVVFESQGSTVRSLLQVQKDCPVSFEFLNYTILTSQCKGPQYPPALCCKALKDFSCPFVDELNDVTNTCAQTMFSYINLYGKYPPGLFANECREGKEGLACPASPPQSNDANASEGYMAHISMLKLGFFFLFYLCLKL